MMRFGLLILLLWQALSPVPRSTYFRYERGVAVDAGAGGVACALLPADVFAHAAPALADLRLYRGAVETPYAITLSAPTVAASEPAKVLNLGMGTGTRSGHIVFDLEMPARPYTAVNLELAGKDFLASAKVSGSASLDAGGRTELGEFTLFDLSGQRLARHTTLDLQESTFAYLHVDLTVATLAGPAMPALHAAMVQGATVPPSREAQTLYAGIDSAPPHGDTVKHETVAVFRVPAHVPVERVSFAIDPKFKGNFSRAVRVSARSEGPAGSQEELAGEIVRVDLTRGGRAIHEVNLGVPATLGVNMQRGATVTVAVEDGDDKPLPIESVRLEMRERKLCFAPAAEAATIFYGDAALRAPVYDFARLFTPDAGVRRARLDAERANFSFTPRPDARPYTERQPDLLWVVLLAVIGILAVIAFRSTRQLRQGNS
jgi:hypothetical protein